MTEHKQLYPIIVIKARDWAIYNDAYRINEKESWDVTNGWMVGWLIKEQEDSLIIAFEVFESRHSSSLNNWILTKIVEGYEPLGPVIAGHQGYMLVSMIKYEEEQNDI